MARLTSALAVLAVTCALAACGDSGDKTPAPTGSPRTSAAPDATGSASPIDACAMLSSQDIAALLGTPIEGKPTGTDPEMGGCVWENPDSYESVTVEIGNPGTVINDTLPPPEPGFPDVGTPGPDGMRFLGSGMVEFPAGGRSNTVQVAVLSMAGDAANNAAVDLARKIGPQVPQ